MTKTDTELTEAIEKKVAEVREQRAKYDAACARGLGGAPFVQIDRKLVRLEHELEEMRRSEELIRLASAW